MGSSASLSSPAGARLGVMVKEIAEHAAKPEVRKLEIQGGHRRSHGLGPVGFDCWAVLTERVCPVDESISTSLYGAGRRLVLPGLIFLTAAIRFTIVGSWGRRLDLKLL